MKNNNAKRIYGACTNVRLLHGMFVNMGDFRRAQRNDSVDKEFAERIMLAVTQVNGCEMCSFHHTGQALKAGMSRQEIDAILGGEFADVPGEQMPAILFAQHYAQTIGRPEKKVVFAFEKEYGDKAQDILCYIRAIMVGNAQGNIIGAFKSRCKGKPEPGSSLFKEVLVLLSDVVVIPVLLLISLITWPFRALKRQGKTNAPATNHNSTY